MWKPGQLVTIEGKVYRICKSKTSIGCNECDFIKNPTCTEPCIDCCDHELIPYECHFKKLQTKCGKQDS